MDCRATVVPAVSHLRFPADPWYAQRQTGQYPLHPSGPATALWNMSFAAAAQSLRSLQASREMCHDRRDEALIYLAKLEADTAP
ncbi:Uncharacterised protein [Serratia fonticola]|uniref:Uncharacterized protein n=1 Tax=Serratia fonticola TaxID=47917 RepID=A0A4U9UYX5_SERFO|nr:Uncharacterised protein [Serratia fonticola]